MIVGLGNPTSKYEQTRHNAGFWFLDEIADRNHLRFSSDSRTQSLLATMEWEGERIFLLKPMQFMNRSGVATAQLANFYKIEAAKILVAHDELDFAPGVVKLKVGGGHGGHNGLRDIVARIGTADFARLRIGIGRPQDRDEVVNYVLDRPSRHEAEVLRAGLGRAADLFPQILSGKLDAVMNALHATN